MKKVLLFLLTLPLVASVNFTLSGGMFSPRASYFKEVYGSSIFNPEAEGEVSFGPFGAFLGVDYIRKQGKLTYSKEKVNLSIIPISLGMRFYFMKMFFADAGIGTWSYSEKTNFISASGSSMGFFAGLGMKYEFGGSTYFRLRTKYSISKKKQNKIESDLSGFQGEVGVGFSF